MSVCVTVTCKSTKQPQTTSMFGWNVPQDFLRQTPNLNMRHINMDVHGCYLGMVLFFKDILTHGTICVSIAG